MTNSRTNLLVYKSDFIVVVKTKHRCTNRPSYGRGIEDVKKTK